MQNLCTILEIVCAFNMCADGITNSTLQIEMNFIFNLGHMFPFLERNVYKFISFKLYITDLYTVK